MIKRLRYPLFAILIAAFVFTAFACTKSSQQENADDSEEPVIVDYANIASIEVAAPTEYEEDGFLLSEFNMSKIMLNIKYVSEEQVEIPASYSMVRAEDKVKLSVAGTHTITLYYGKFTITFKLRLYNVTENVFRVEFIDWEGNRVGDVQYLKSGQVAIVPSLETRDGYDFLGWENSETGTLVTSFTFTQDVTLVASYTLQYYTVEYLYNADGNPVTIATRKVRRGDDAYKYAPEIPIIEGYSKGRWEDVEAMKNVSSDGLKFYAIYDRDSVNATFVYYKFLEGEWYSYDVYCAVADAKHGIDAPDDVNRTASEIFLYWYIKHIEVDQSGQEHEVEVRVDFPYVLTAETTFYAKYVPVETGSKGLEMKFLASPASEEGYYITGYDGDDRTVAIPNKVRYDGETRYIFMQEDVDQTSDVSDLFICAGAHMQATETSVYQSNKKYYEQRFVEVTADGYYSYVPFVATTNDPITEDKKSKTYDYSEGNYVLTPDEDFISGKKYYEKQSLVIRNGFFYFLDEDLRMGDDLTGYYYLRDNNFISVRDGTIYDPRLNMQYYVRETAFDIGDTVLFVKENRTVDNKTYYIPEDGGEIIGLMNDPFKDNGAERFYVANGNNVFRINNDSLYSADLTVLYAYPTEKTYSVYPVEGNEVAPKIISDYAFYGAKHLTTLRLPLSVESIGAHAFENCLITDLYIPENVTTIGAYGFAGCETVQSITFSGEPKIRSLGEFCFAGLYRLTEISLPISLEQIGTGIFDKCTSLAQISIDNEYFTVDRSNGGLYGKKDNVQYYYLICFPSKYTGVTNGVVNINFGARVVKKGAFSYAGVFEIAFSSEGNSIQFEEGSVVCPNLRSIRLNCTAVTMPKEAFYDEADNSYFLPTELYVHKDRYAGVISCLNLGSLDMTEERNVHRFESVADYAEYKSFYENFGYETENVSGELRANITAYRGIDKSVSVPEILNGAVVVSIDKNAFRGNNAVEEVILPDSVTSIGPYAFYGCSELRKVALGLNLTNLGDMAFASCRQLSEVTAPERAHIDKVGKTPFDNTPFVSGTFAIVAGVLFSYNGIADIIEIPSNIYIIAESAFENCRSMTKLVFSGDSQLNEIYPNAFKGCENLVEVVFPSHLTRIGDSCFEGCAHLFAVVFVSSLAPGGLPSNAFTGTGSIYGLTSCHVFTPDKTTYGYTFEGFETQTGYYVLRAPDAVKSDMIFEGWFTDASHVTSAVFPRVLTATSSFYAKFTATAEDTGEITYVETDGGYEVTGYTGTKKYVTIPSEHNGKAVVSVADNAFKNRDIAYFYLPPTVKHVGVDAFANTTWINNYTEKNVVLGSVLLCYKGFEKNYSLPTDVGYVADGAFKEHTTIETVVLNTHVTVVPKDCFLGCENLTRVTLNKDVTEICAGAFKNCAKLVTVDYSMAKKLRTVHSTAFDGSYFRSHYLGDSIIINDVYYAYIGSGHTLHVPNGVTLINAYAFYNNPSVRYVYVPESAEKIGDYAFSKSALEKIFFTDSINSLASIGAYAFEDCINAVDYNFRSCVNLTEIKEGAYKNVKSKTDDDHLAFYVPAKTETMGKEAFAGSDVYAVYFTDGSRLDVIPQSCFEGAEKLVSVRFLGQTSLETIEKYAFKGCVLLQTFISDKAELKNIGEEAFAMCNKLTVFGVNERSLDNIGEGAFDGTSYIGDDTMVFIGNVLMKYNGIQSTVYLPESTTVIARGAFSDNNRITSILISGESLEEIQFEAFSNCSSLTSLTLPSSLKKIAGGAFSGCDALTTITVSTTGRSEGYISVDGVLFRYYTTKDNRNLAELVAYPNAHASVYSVPVTISREGLPFSVVSIADYAFKGCKDLITLTIPDTVSSLGGRNAFVGCRIVYLTAPAYLLPDVPKTALKTVTITSGTEIAADSLKGGSLLLSVSIPVTVTKIGRNAFSGCRSLNTIIIPTNVSTIEEDAFSGCYRLVELDNRSSLSIAAGNTDFGYAGYYCKAVYQGEFTSKLFAETFDGEVYDVYKDGSDVILIGYNGSNPNLTIPSTVTTINHGAFYECNVNSIVIPGSVTSIGDDAFYNCPIKEATVPALACSSIANPSLTKVVITSGTEIASGAFAGCRNLTNLTIASTIVSIGSDAFDGCYRLVEVCNLSSNITVTAGSSSNGSVGLYAKKIYGDSAYQTMLSTDDNGFLRYIDAANGENILVGYNGTESRLVVPTGTTEIYQYSLTGYGFLTEVLLPDSVSKIGPHAFEGCYNLTGFTVPVNVTSIGADAFLGCYKLIEVYNKSASLTIDKGVAGDSYIGYYAKAVYTDNTTSKLSKNKNGYILYKEGKDVVLVGYTGDETRLTLPNNVTEINSGAFYNREDIAEIIIPDTVEKIGEYAFENCSSLTYTQYDNGLYLGNEDNPYLVLAKALNKTVSSCVISEETKIVSYGAFVDCTVLTSIDIPNNVTFIGQRAFFGCSSLTEVSISDRVTSINVNTFELCANLSTVYTPASLIPLLPSANISFVGVTSGLEIADSAFDGYGKLQDVEICAAIQQIGAKAFMGCSLMQTITVEDSSALTRIGMEAFSGCAALSSFKFGKDSILQSIGEKAFFGCTGLAAISIPDIVSSIGASAFSGCDSLATVNIPDYLSEIGEQVFASCAMREIVIPGGVSNIAAGAFRDCANLSSVTIPSSVSSIGEGIFNNCPIQTASIPAHACLSVKNGVLTSVVITSGTTIPVNALSNCTNLTSVIISAGITTIGAYAFDGCSGLTTVTFVSGSRLETIAESAFCGCAFDSIDIPSGVSSIGRGAFSGCSALSSIEIPDGVEVLPTLMCYECMSLANVIIPDSIEAIGDDAFGLCPIERITLPAHLISKVNLTAVTRITLTSGVSIQDGALKNCTTLQRIVIPSTVAMIGTEAFSGCSNLTSVEFISGSQLSIIGRGAFKNCSSLATFVTPSIVSHIESEAFLGCENLSSITIPSNNLTTLGDKVFNGCNLLLSDENRTANAYYLGDANNEYLILLKVDDTSASTIAIQPSTKFIAYSAFEGWTNLNDVEIPSSVVSIGCRAFKGCSSLSGITIPSGVETIDANAFEMCRNLVTINLPSGLLTINDGLFSGCSSLNYLTLPGAIQNIGNDAFYGCESLVTITIPDSVRRIGSGAFSDCDDLSSVIFGSDPQIDTIDDNAFFGCVSLKVLSIPERVTSIGDGAFRNCNRLMTVAFKSDDNLRSIGSYAFNGCYSLLLFSVPSSLETIGDNAFEDCFKLVEIMTTAGNELGIIKGSENNGRIAYYAKNVYSDPADSKLTVIDENYLVYVDDELDKRYLLAYSGVETALTIPAGIDVVYDYAFFGMDSIASVVIPSTITLIGKHAFDSCVGLTTVEISSGVTAIGQGAFSGCEYLTTVTIPDSIGIITRNLFLGCIRLSSVKIDNAATMLIETGAFGRCGSLTCIDFTVGTTADWNDIVKEEGWDEQTGDYTVQCSDGVIV